MRTIGEQGGGTMRANGAAAAQFAFDLIERSLPTG